MIVCAMSTSTLWAAVFIIIAPIVIIAAGELENRLIYRDSLFVPTVSILRTWVLPLTAILVVTGGFLGFGSFLARVIGTALVLAVTADLIAVLGVFVQILKVRGDGDARKQIPRLLLALPRILLILLAAWVLLSGVWSVNLSSLFAALGVSTLIVSVALQDTLSGVASGFLLMLDRPFQPGDWITATNIEGRVLDTNWRSTRIQNRDGDLVAVPNGELAGATIINFDQPERLHRIVVDVQVAFTNPPTIAKNMLLDAARATPGVLADPPPTINVVQVDDPLMGYQAHLWVDDFATVPRVASDFRSLVWYMSQRHNVPLPSPAFDLYNYDGIQAAAASQIDGSELRRRLMASPLLAELNDADLDQIATASSAARFAIGEVMIAPDRDTSTLLVIWEGSARLEVVDGHGSVYDVADLGEGDVCGLVAASSDSPVLPRTVAVTDCEVVSIDLNTAGPVISKNPDLADALNQIEARRARRIRRIVGGLTTPAENDEERTVEGEGS
jgi:small-conductance mechanosensitive channel/CRP-like cAMP-binding protein